MYSVFISEYFRKQLKPLVKKDTELKAILSDVLKNFDKQGVVAIGGGIFKLRLRKVGMGKSGGYRLYIFVMEVDGILSPVCIYAKNDRENVTKKCVEDSGEKPQYIFVNNKPVAVFINIDEYEAKFLRPELIELNADQVDEDLQRRAEKARKMKKKDLTNI